MCVCLSVCDRLTERKTETNRQRLRQLDFGQFPLLLVFMTYQHLGLFNATSMRLEKIVVVLFIQ